MLNGMVLQVEISFCLEYPPASKSDPVHVTWLGLANVIWIQNLEISHLLKEHRQWSTKLEILCHCIPVSTQFDLIVLTESDSLHNLNSSLEIFMRYGCIVGILR